MLLSLMMFAFILSPVESSGYILICLKQDFLKCKKKKNIFNLINNSLNISEAFINWVKIIRSCIFIGNLHAKC